MADERLPRPEVVFFDLFGTLFRWSKLPRHAIADALAAHDYMVDPDQVQRARREIERKLPSRDEFPSESEAQYWGHYNEDLLRRLHIDPKPVLLDALRHEFEKNVSIGLQEDAMPALQGLKRMGVGLGVISNATFGAKRDCIRLKLGPLFGHIVISQAINARKPDPHIFLVALSKFGCPPTRAWMVGDEPDADVKGARGVGMVPILVDRAGAALEPRATVVRALTELPTLYRNADA